MSFDLKKFQDEVGVWTEHNFGVNREGHQPVLGVCEEAGELAHARLKLEQGIRGTKEEHLSDMMDAIGDIVVFLADVCNLHNFDLEEIVDETWVKVQQRDWKVDSEKGVKESKPIRPSIDSEAFDGRNT